MENSVFDDFVVGVPILNEKKKLEFLDDIIAYDLECKEWIDYIIYFEDKGDYKTAKLVREAFSTFIEEYINYYRKYV